MKTSYKVILVAVIIGLCVVLFDAAVDYFFFHERSFWDVPAAELWMRSVMIASFVIFGILAARLIAQRERAKAKTDRLNAVLRTISNVNQLIASEKDRYRLLQGVCDTLIETRSYCNAWMALLDESGGLVTSAEAGFGKDFAPLLKRLARGESINCARKALTRSDVVVIEDPFSTCGDCPLAKMYSGGGTMSIRLEYDGIVYGLLSISMPQGFTANDEERSFLKEVAGDIILALHNMELEEALEKHTHDLGERVKELNCLYGISNLAGQHDISLEEILQGIVDLIPPSWQYSEITCARLSLANQEFKTENFQETTWKQNADIVVRGERSGSVEVYYLEERPESDEVPFLKEERRLIKAIVEEVGRTIELKQAEQVLRESEERLRGIVGSAATGIYVVREGKFHYVSPQFEEISGYTSDELIGTRSLDYIHPEDREAARKGAIENLKGQSSSPHEFRFTTKGGETIWALEKVVSIQYAGERAAIGSFMDITERKRAEEMLAQAAVRWQDTFDAIEDLVAIIDKDCRVVRANKAMNEAFAGATVVGSQCHELFHGTQGPIPGCPGSQVFSSGKTTHVEVCEPHLGSRWFGVCAYPIKSEGGRVQEVVHVVKDITERRRAEEEIAIFRRFAEASGQGLAMASLEGVVTYVNPTLLHILGEDNLEDAVGKSLLSYYPEELQQRMLDEVLPSVMQEGQWTGELALISTKGKQTPTIENVFLIRDEKGAPLCLADVMTDVSEQKRAEEERVSLLEDMKVINRKLEQSNRELQDFAYVASHDLQEPLRKISAFAGLIQDSLKGKLDEDQQENLGFMIGGARRMQTMVDDLLAYSRVTSKTKPHEQVDLNEVIENLKNLELAGRLDEAKGSIRVPEPLPLVEGDPSQVLQLLQNLIGNALKFHREAVPPEVIVRARNVETNMIRVEVQDNGIGIDEQYHEQVFTMFKRLQSSTRYEGTGIGLAVCKKIVERHDGDIGVRSTPEEGSTFWFTLPSGTAQEKISKKTR